MTHRSRGLANRPGEPYPAAFRCFPNAVDLMGVEPIAPTLQESVASTGMQAHVNVRIQNLECRMKIDHSLVVRIGNRASDVIAIERKPWDSNPQRSYRTCFRDRLLIRPDDFRLSSSGGWNRTNASGFRARHRYQQRQSRNESA